MKQNLNEVLLKTLVFQARINAFRYTDVATEYLLY